MVKENTLSRNRFLIVMLAILLAFGAVAYGAFANQSVWLSFGSTSVEAAAGCPEAKFKPMPNPTSAWVHGPANIQLYRDDGSLIIASRMVKVPVPKGTTVRLNKVKGARWWWTTRTQACVKFAKSEFRKLPGWIQYVPSLRDADITVAMKQSLAPIKVACKTSVWLKKGKHC